MSLEHADIACVEVERKLSHAVRFSRAHYYVDALRSNNNKFLHTMQRQAILCMTLHNIAILIVLPMKSMMNEYRLLSESVI